MQNQSMSWNQLQGDSEWETKAEKTQASNESMGKLNPFMRMPC